MTDQISKVTLIHENYTLDVNLDGNRWRVHRGNAIISHWYTDYIDALQFFMRRSGYRPA
jgi:hypothetical protein